MNKERHQPVRLDLNNPVFQRQLFNLSRIEQHNILNTLRKLATMIWQQLYFQVSSDSVHPLFAGLTTEQLEELGEKFFESESLNEIRGWAEEKRLSKAQ